MSLPTEGKKEAKLPFPISCFIDYTKFKPSMLKNAVCSGKKTTLVFVHESSHDGVTIFEIRRILPAILLRKY